MEKKRFLAVILSAVFLTGALGALVVYVVTTAVSGTRSLPELLERADDFLSQAYLSEADEAVSQAFDAAMTTDELLSVLKRSLRLAELKNDYSSFKQLAMRAFRKNPGSSELCRVALYAALRDGDAAGALSLSHGFAALPDVQALTGEALFRAGTPLEDERLQEIPLFRDYILLDTVRDPDRFLEAARVLQDERFYLDAALLFMAQGRIDDAYLTAEQHLFDERFDEAAAMIAYDKKEYRRALERLSRIAAREPETESRADLSVIRGDLDLLLGREDRAQAAYERAIEIKPDYSAIPYINLAWLMQERGYTEKAFFLAGKAYELFPRDKRAVMEFAKRLFRRGDHARSQEVIERYLAEWPAADDVA
ncbi:MAG TPA: tetratricopeptide repeat protein, partial [Spirochaetia bacterium]|nr:tetratricopeptide repeat protein [Spirochaetia bacterium]